MELQSCCSTLTLHLITKLDGDRFLMKIYFYTFFDTILSAKWQIARIISCSINEFTLLKMFTMQNLQYSDNLY